MTDATHQPLHELEAAPGQLEPGYCFLPSHHGQDTNQSSLPKKKTTISASAPSHQKIKPPRQALRPPGVAARFLYNHNGGFVSSSHDDNAKLVVGMPEFSPSMLDRPTMSAISDLKRECCSSKDSVRSRLTVIITTSPVPSNPSVAVLSQLLSSFRLVSGLEDCERIVVFDGYEVRDRSEPKSGRVTPEEALNYEEYAAAVQDAIVGAERVRTGVRSVCKTRITCKATCDANVLTCPGGMPPAGQSAPSPERSHPTVTFLRPSARLGFALAVRAAMMHVTTPYVMVAQHDWAFAAALDVAPLLRAMDMHPSTLHYVGFLSAGSLSYAGRGGALARVPPLEAEEDRFGVPLVKLFFWYDKTHVARADHYRHFVFGHGRFRRGDFIEDTLGHCMLADVRENGLAAHAKYGTFLYYPDGGQRRYLQHLDGRKFLSPAQRAEKEAEGRATGAIGRRKLRKARRHAKEMEEENQ